MARDILFRGKRTDNGEWVEGFYFCMVHEDGRHVHHFIIPLGTDLNLGTPIGKIQVEVDPETICQYTGRHDRTGRRIFEGDIADVYGEFLKIEWDEITASFWFVKTDSQNREFYKCFFGENRGEENCEVIGNIFDNPELVEGGAR